MALCPSSVRSIATAQTTGKHFPAETKFALFSKVYFNPKLIRQGQLFQNGLRAGDEKTKAIASFDMTGEPFHIAGWNCHCLAAFTARGTKPPLIPRTTF